MHKKIIIYSSFRVPRPPPNDDQFYTVEDFNIGRELTLYGRVFKLTACDEFTRNFLTKLGVRVPPPDGTPEDPYSDHRKAVSWWQWSESFLTALPALHHLNISKDFSFTTVIISGKHILALHNFLNDESDERMKFWIFLPPPNWNHHHQDLHYLRYSHNKSFTRCWLS